MLPNLLGFFFNCRTLGKSHILSNSEWHRHLNASVLIGFKHRWLVGDVKNRQRRSLHGCRKSRSSSARTKKRYTKENNRETTVDLPSCKKKAFHTYAMRALRFNSLSGGERWKPKLNWRNEALSTSCSLAVGSLSVEMTLSGWWCVRHYKNDLHWIGWLLIYWLFDWLMD